MFREPKSEVNISVVHGRGERNKIFTLFSVVFIKDCNNLRVWVMQLKNCKKIK